ncbi:hypothetical protein ACPZ8W_27300, partial [Klebsiella variicola subsp. variicola]
MRNRFPVTLWLALVALVAALALPARANTWPLPPQGSRLVGQNTFHVVQDNGLGAETHLFVRKHAPLRSFDPLIVETLVEVMNAEGP